MRLRQVARGQVWADIATHKERPIDISPDGKAILGKPHYLVLIHDEENAILAPACFHRGRWVQTLIGEGERRMVALDDLAAPSCSRTFELVSDAA